MARSDYSSRLITSVILEDDVVPRLCLGSVRNMSAALNYMDAASDETPPSMAEVRQRAMTNPVLYPPGRLILIREHVAKVVTTECFGEILLRPALVEDHMPWRYRAEMTAILPTQVRLAAQPATPAVPCRPAAPAVAYIRPAATTTLRDPRL